MELIILIVIAVFVISYRMNNGENVYRFFISQVSNAYNKYAPYSFKEVRAKSKELGAEYTPKQYATQIVIFAGVAGGISYLYFYNMKRQMITKLDFYVLMIIDMFIVSF